MCVDDFGFILFAARFRVGLVGNRGISLNVWPLINPITNPTIKHIIIGIMQTIMCMFTHPTGQEVNKKRLALATMPGAIK